MFKAIVWILKRFWFPILMFVLARLGKTKPWAAKAHATIKKVAEPSSMFRGKSKK